MLASGLRYNKQIWEGILKCTYYCLGLTIIYFFTGCKLIETKKADEYVSEYLSKMSDSKIYEKSFSTLTKKFKKFFNNKSKGIM